MKMRSIPPAGSIPQAIRGRRIHASIGFGTRGITRAQQGEQSSWDGDVQRHVFKGRDTAREKQAPSLYGQIQLSKTLIQQVEEDIKELEVFAKEGIRVDEELARLSERKRNLQALIERNRKEIS